MCDLGRGTYYIIKIITCKTHPPFFEGKKEAMSSSCCAVECQKRCKAGKATLYTFPKDPVQRRQWIQALHCEGWEPTLSSRVCGRHFISGRH